MNSERYSIGEQQLPTCETAKEFLMEPESASNQLRQNGDKARRRDERLLI